MLIKKYIGRDIDELVNSIDGELGPDAIILMTRTIERGVFFSFNNQPEIEITAGVEPELLRKHNPYHDGLGEVRTITPASFDIEAPINCTGAILPDSESVTLLAIAGSNEKAVIDSCIKLIQYFRKETPYRVVLLCIKQIFENNSAGFQDAADQNQIPYDLILDRFSLSESMSKYKDYDFLIAGFPAGMHSTHIKSYLEGATPVWIELVVSTEADIGGYKKLHPQGIIINSPEGEADLGHLPEMLRNSGIPLSFIAHQGKLVVAQPEQVETMIINSKLKT